MEETETSTDPNRMLEVPPRAEYHCDSCGYGAVAFGPPGTCPICGCNDWKHGVRPKRDGVVVKRLASSTFLLTPPPELDAATANELADAVADLAHERPDVVVDLSDVRVLEEPAARLLLHLAALAQGA